MSTGRDYIKKLILDREAAAQKALLMKNQSRPQGVQPGFFNPDDTITMSDGRIVNVINQGGAYGIVGTFPANLDTVVALGEYQPMLSDDSAPIFLQLWAGYYAADDPGGLQHPSKFIPIIQDINKNIWYVMPDNRINFLNLHFGSRQSRLYGKLSQDATRLIFVGAEVIKVGNAFFGTHNLGIESISFTGVNLVAPTDGSNIGTIDFSSSANDFHTYASNSFGINPPNPPVIPGSVPGVCAGNGQPCIAGFDGIVQSSNSGIQYSTQDSAQQGVTIVLQDTGTEFIGFFIARLVSMHLTVAQYFSPGICSDSSDCGSDFDNPIVTDFASTNSTLVIGGFLNSPGTLLDTTYEDITGINPTANYFALNLTGSIPAIPRQFGIGPIPTFFGEQTEQLYNAYSPQSVDAYGSINPVFVKNNKYYGLFSKITTDLVGPFSTVTSNKEYYFQSSFVVNTQVADLISNNQRNQVFLYDDANTFPGSLGVFDAFIAGASAVPSYQLVDTAKFNILDYSPNNGNNTVTYSLSKLVYTANPLGNPTVSQIKTKTFNKLNSPFPTNNTWTQTINPTVPIGSQILIFRSPIDRIMT